MFVRSKLLQLGEKIVAELGADHSVDTLGRWMAHHLAELIDEAENADEGTRHEKMARCEDAILKLWAHRRELPNGKRPFEDFEPILDALESLNPDDDKQRYFRFARSQAKNEALSDDGEKWLQIAEAIDHSARILIGVCLARAAEDVVDGTKEWVELAEKAGEDDAVDIMAIRFVTRENELVRDEEPTDPDRRLLEERLRKLETFVELADGWAADLRKRLSDVEPS